MIPVLLTWLIRKLILYIRSGHHIIALIIIVSMLSKADAQVNQRMYDVLYKGDHVGAVTINIAQKQDSIHYRIVSDISTRFIFRIKVRSVEESVFHNGRLIHSAVHRDINGNNKVDRSTVAANNSYAIHREGSRSILKSDDITFNVMKLYISEPVGITKIYSDNHQQFLRLTKTAPHVYRLNLPDENYNLYTYINGVCTKVEVFSQLFDMQMILR